MITDREVQLLAALAEGLRTEYQTEEDSSWSHSPFGWIKWQASRRKGAIGEKLVAGWCAARDINVLRSPDAEADRILEGFRTEIKFSTLWANQSYKFQQIRDQDYELLVCLGVSPSRLTPGSSRRSSWSRIPAWSLDCPINTVAQRAATRLGSAYRQPLCIPGWMRTAGT